MKYTIKLWNLDPKTTIIGQYHHTKPSGLTGLQLIFMSLEMEVTKQELMKRFFIKP